MFDAGRNVAGASCRCGGQVTRLSRRKENKNRTHTAPLDLPEGVTSIVHINAHYHCSRSRKVPDTTLDSEITFVLINPVMHPAGQA